MFYEIISLLSCSTRLTDINEGKHNFISSADLGGGSRGPMNPLSLQKTKKSVFKSCLRMHYSVVGDKSNNLLSSRATLPSFPLKCNGPNFSIKNSYS